MVGGEKNSQDRPSQYKKFHDGSKEEIRPGPGLHLLFKLSSRTYLLFSTYIEPASSTIVLKNLKHF